VSSVVWWTVRGWGSDSGWDWSGSRFSNVGVDDVQSLLDLCWDWWWSWEMSSLRLESIFISKVLDLDELSFWGIVLVRSLGNLDAFFTTGFQVSRFLSLGSIRSFPQILVASVTIVLVFGSDDSDVSWVSSGLWGSTKRWATELGSGHTEEGNEHQLKQGN
jgi:hypothetical protein